MERTREGQRRRERKGERGRGKYKEERGGGKEEGTNGDRKRRDGARARRMPLSVPRKGNQAQLNKCDDSFSLKCKLSSFSVFVSRTGRNGSVCVYSTFYLLLSPL